MKFKKTEFDEIGHYYYVYIKVVFCILLDIILNLFTH